MYSPNTVIKNSPLIIVGMARSGTTLTSHLLGSLPGAYTEIEPHALWKSGNFKYFNDEEYDLHPKRIKRIRKKFLKVLPEGKVLVEKSPINCLRPELVHQVFPEVKIIYVERDPVRCIYSNYERSLKSDSFKLSIILKKYFSHSGSKDLEGAIGKRGLLEQISISDTPYFLLFTLRMMYVRNVLGLLPFGPKLKGFQDIVKKEGLLSYHIKVYKAALKNKKKFKDLYGEDNFATFRMEDLMTNKDEIKRLFKFSKLDYTDDLLENIGQTLSPERIQKSSKPQEKDKQIKELLQEY